MATEIKPLIVLTLLDTTDALWSEELLAILRAIIEKGNPDLICTIATGPTGYFIPSADATRRVESILTQTEALRISDNRFAHLGLGLSLGNLMVDCNWWGKISKSNHPPLGNANNDAWKVAQTPGAYHEILKRLPR